MAADVATFLGMDYTTVFSEFKHVLVRIDIVVLLREGVLCLTHISRSNYVWQANNTSPPDCERSEVVCLSRFPCLAV